MPQLVEPLSPDLRRQLRRAVLHHASSERRRRHLALLHVGVPGGTECIVPAGPACADLAEGDGGPDDHALRVDVLAALLRRADAGDAVLVWLTRAGDLDLQDVDASWLAASVAAAAEAEIDLTMVVVNRHGWRDPRTGAAAHWKRLRA